MPRTLESFARRQNLSTVVRPVPQHLPAPRVLQSLAIGFGSVLLAMGISTPLAAMPAETGAANRTEAVVLPMQGMSLSDALNVLQADGLRIVYTRQTVRRRMRVEYEPKATDPRARLAEVLSPHGLQVVELDESTLVIVADADHAPAPPSIAGVVRSRDTSEPIPGATVRILETDRQVESGTNGRFVFDDLEEGLYTVEARLWGFVDALETEVAATEGHISELRLALQPAPFFHDKVVVRPTQLSLLHEDPAAPLALSRGEIEALPHLASDIFRALSLLPGVTANDVSAQFHIHGGRRDEVKILLDGQELYEAYHLKDYDNALSIVPAQGLEIVTLATGGLPANHGDRMSGVLDMRTSRPVAGEYTRLSFSLLNAMAMRGGELAAGRGHWLASGRRGAIGLARRLLGDEDPSFWDAFGKMELEVDDHNSVRAHVLRAGDRLGFETIIDADTERLDTEYDTTYAWATHQVTFGRGLLAKTRVATTRVERDRRGIEDEEEQAFSVTDQRRFDVEELAHDWLFQPTPRHALEWGLEARHYDARYDYTNESSPAFILSTPLSPPRIPINRFAGAFDGDHLGLFVSDRFSVLDRLTLELGLRYDRHTLTDDTLLSPRVNAAWRLGDGADGQAQSVVRASWGHFHQSQRPYELQVEDGETRFFRAERAEHWVLGYERLFARHTGGGIEALRIEAYGREVSNPRPRFESFYEPINFFPEVEPDRVRIVPASTRVAGLEIAIRGRFGKRFEWWTNYAYASVEDRVAGEKVRRQVDQPHTLNVDLNIRVGPRWNINIAWRLRSGWTTTPAAVGFEADEEGELQPVVQLGRLNSERLSTYHRLDLRASRQWAVQRGTLTFFVDVQNAYNRRNVAGFDLSIDEDTGELIRGSESWPGFLPSAGITWTF